MAAATIHSDFGAQENKVCHCFQFFPSIWYEVMEPDAVILAYLITWRFPCLFGRLRSSAASVSPSFLGHVCSVQWDFLDIFLSCLAMWVPTTIPERGTAFVSSTLVDWRREEQNQDWDHRVWAARPRKPDRMDVRSLANPPETQDPLAPRLLHKA